MTKAATQRRFEDLLSRVQRPARLVGGEVGSTSGFAGDARELRVVLAYPDVYEIGISNQAIQVLYGIARDTTGVGVERAYLPWVDAIGEMRREGIPLLTLETWTPVASADVLGVTLQHESGFTNLLELLDLSGIPLRTGNRDDRCPLVVAGGPACSNFLPVAPFLDAIVVGDGEEVFAEILDVLRGAKLKGADRTEIKRRLSGLEGVFVPGLSKTVARRCVTRLDDAPYPTECLVPVTEGVHDRAWVEVMRGCTRGCRFCQAGMWYRPVRERPLEQVLTMVENQLAATGYHEVALASLSTTDHSSLEEILREQSRARPEVRVSLPSLRVDGAAVRLASLTSPTGGSLTLAPEAGSQRMRDIVNKNVTEEDVLSAAREAVGAGKTTLKLYFMIGLPWEEDEDVTAIANLCLAVRDEARKAMGARGKRLQLNVSVNNFIPKPFTPFQWMGMASGDTLERRQGLIRARLRKQGLKVSFSRPDVSFLEAALARGDEGMSTIIEDAWRRGARLDSWTDQFQVEAWNRAFHDAGLSTEELATSEIDREVELPWDVIKATVDKEFLVREWERASRGETTSDCRWDECSACGVCGEGLENRLTGPGLVELSTQAPRKRPQTSERWRYVATFRVTGRGRFLGHLDRAEMFRRAVRRAGGHLALSAGMRPKAILSLAAPLAVGWEGLAELAQFELAEPADARFERRLAESLPEHARLVALNRYSVRISLASRVRGAAYEVIVRPLGAAEGVEEKLTRGAELLKSSPEFVVEDKRGHSMRRLDVKKYVDAVIVSAEGGDRYKVAFEAGLGPGGTARPERVAEALGVLAGVDLRLERITRTGLRLSEADD